MKPYKKLLSRTEIADKKREVEELVRMVNGSDRNSDVGYFRHSSDRVDAEEIGRLIHLRKRELHHGTPKKFKGKQADKALAMIKKLDKVIKEKIPKNIYVTFKEQNEGVNDFERSVKAEQEWKKCNVSFKGHKPMHITEARHYLMRRLDPDAPRKDFRQFQRERM